MGFQTSQLQSYKANEWVRLCSCSRQANAEAFEQARATLERRTASLQADLRQATDARDAAARERDGFAERVASLQTDLAARQDDLAALRRAHAALQSDHDALAAARDTLEARLREATDAAAVQHAADETELARARAACDVASGGLRHEAEARAVAEAALEAARARAQADGERAAAEQARLASEGAALREALEHLRANMMRSEEAAAQLRQDKDKADAALAQVNILGHPSAASSLPLWLFSVLTPWSLSPRYAAPCDQFSWFMFFHPFSLLPPPSLSPCPSCATSILRYVPRAMRLPRRRRLCSRNRQSVTRSSQPPARRAMTSPETSRPPLVGFALRFPLQP